MTDDRELLKAWRAGDQRAGRVLFEQFFDPLYRFFRTKLPDQAEDLVQQTFLACVQQGDNLEAVQSVRAYLFIVARNKLYDEIRRRARRPDLARIEATPIDSLGPSPSSLFMRKQDENLLLHALRRIPLELQVAVELFYVERLRGPELAAVLELPEGTVRSRLRRARILLKAELETLGASAVRVKTTLTNIEAWAAEVREAAKNRG